MKKSVPLLLILFCIANLLYRSSALGYDDVKMTYKQFKTKFQKPDLPSNQQSQRENIFYSNLLILKAKLDQGCEYCGVTKFFDQTSEEFRGRMGLLPEQFSAVSRQFGLDQIGGMLSAEQVSEKDNLVKVGDAPAYKNWADEGKITSIKNQGSCGTCWSFATAAAVQSSLILSGKATNFFFYQPDLAQQFLLTCATHGTCKGGYLQQAIDLAYQKGIPYQSDLPYQARKGDSSICSNTRGNARYTDGKRGRFSYYDIGDNQIINLLQQGPVMIALSADDWEYYGGGTFTCKSTAQVNHAVLLVGYDADRWIVKNQWGTNWGEKGYIYITRNRTRNCKIGTAVHQLWDAYLISSSLLLLVSLLVLL